MRIILFIVALSLTLVGAFILLTHGPGSENVGVAFTVFGAISTLIQLFFNVPLGKNTVSSIPIYTVTRQGKRAESPSQNSLALLSVLLFIAAPLLCTLSGPTFSPANDKFQEILIIAAVISLVASLILYLILKMNNY